MFFFFFFFSSRRRHTRSLCDWSSDVCSSDLTAKAEPLLTDASVSPTGKRGVFNARGDVFTVPAEYGAVLNVTRSSGVAERFARWSPDGKTLAFWSDRSGEYELTLRAADGTGTDRKVPSRGPGFRYAPHWSPD